MAIALEYKTLVAWRTFAMNVRLQQKETEENPAEYRMRVSPVDRHELGAGTVDNECYFISFMGNPYTVINTGVNYIDVRDDFRVRTAPTAAKIGIVYKSVDNSPFIAPVFYRYLHKTALDNMRKIELSIVWQYANLLNNGWTPVGIIFDFDPETGFLSHTAGQLNVANWYSQRPEKRLDPETAIDTTPVHKAFTVAANSFEILEPDAYFIYALFPVDKNVSTVQFQVSKQYWREKMFNGFICVLVGVLNSEDDNRELSLLWNNKKTFIINNSIQKLFGTTILWNVTSGIHATLTISGNTTITLSNLVEGTSGNLSITNPSMLYTLMVSGYTNKISPSAYLTSNQLKVSGSSKLDVFSWYYDGTYLWWNGGQDYK